MVPGSRPRHDPSIPLHEPPGVEPEHVAGEARDVDVSLMGYVEDVPRAASLHSAACSRAPGRAPLTHAPRPACFPVRPTHPAFEPAVSVLLSTIAPVFGIMAFGFAAARLRWMDAASVRGLVLFVFNFAIPVLLFG